MKINVLDLIEALRGSKFIYDKFDESYKDSRKKSEFWINLGLQFGESGDELKARWNNLRDYQNKEYKKTLDKPSGSAGPPYISNTNIQHNHIKFHSAV
ncbi:unnamed protein product [Gordionus sp. m RMFG-2023]